MLSHVSVKYFKQAVNASSYRETNLDISCRCPICGDSKVKKNSKRLHLYKKGDVELINCFNAGCSCENKTIYSFLKDFYPSLLPQYKRETFGTKMKELKKSSSFELADDSWKKSSDPENLDCSQDLVDSSKNESPELADDSWKNESNPVTFDNSLYTLPVVFDLKPFFEPLSQEMKEYLRNRKIEPSEKWYKAKTNIKISEITYNIKDYLVIPLYLNGNMYGFYSRSISEKKFITFISTVGYKVWNWFDIDKSKNVYIFEAIFDALSTGLDNIIANLGAKLPQERLDELKSPIFCLDNDKTGIETSIKYAEQGHKVFIMPSIYKEKDFNELKNNHPSLDIPELVKNNTFKGMPAITRLKLKL